MKRIKEAIKRKVYLYRLEKLQTYFKNIQLENIPIIISGSPRGGTTWVNEVIQSASNAFCIWEPLHPKNIEEYYPNTNQWFHKYIPPTQNVASLNKFVSEVCKASFITESMLQTNKHFKSYKTCNRLLIKFCRLNALLPWFVNNFKQYKVIQIYRNPLAVVASQMKHGAWNYKKDYNGYELSGHEYFPEFYLQFSNILTEPKLQLETWKKHLNIEQADRVKSILSKFGFQHIEDVDYSLEIDKEIQL